MWWGRHEDIFEVDLKGLEDAQKIRLLLRHVHYSVQKQFEDSIMPKKPNEMLLSEVTDSLKKMFGDNRTLFEKRRTMMVGATLRLIFACKRRERERERESRFALFRLSQFAAKKLSST